MFKNGDTLPCFDGWCRFTRFIDYGKELKSERMRIEIKSLHIWQIKNLESVPIGIAEFELMWREYIATGGPESSDNEQRAT